MTEAEVAPVEVDVHQHEGEITGDELHHVGVAVEPREAAVDFDFLEKIEREEEEEPRRRLETGLEKMDRALEENDRRFARKLGKAAPDEPGAEEQETEQQAEEETGTPPSREKRREGEPAEKGD